MIVVDASALLEVLLHTPAAERVAEHLLATGEPLHAPHLLDLEIAQVLRRYVRGGEIDVGRAEVALADLADLPMERHPHDVLLSRVWALRANATAYDAAYLALAEALPATLVTRDGALGPAGWHRARVIVVA
jgi:predicted nucleic acid-binding protein